MTEKSTEPLQDDAHQYWNCNADIKTSVKRKLETDKNSSKKLCTVERSVESKKNIDINKNIETSTESIRYKEDFTLVETDLTEEENFTSRMKKQPENDCNDGDLQNTKPKVFKNVILEKFQIPVKSFSENLPMVNRINPDEVPLWDDKENNNINDKTTYGSSEYVKFPIRRCNIKNQAHDQKKYVEVHDKISVFQDNSQKVFRCSDCGKIYSNILHASYVVSNN